MPAGLATTDKIKGAMSAPTLPVAPETGGSTDDDLAALAEQLSSRGTPEPSAPAKAPKPAPQGPKSVRRDSTADYAEDGEDDNESPLPSSDEPEDDSDESLDDAADTDAGEDDDASWREALAEAYEIDPSQLAGFTTAKDAEAALALLDQQYAAGQGEFDDYEQSQPANRQRGQQPTEYTPQELAELALDVAEWEEAEPLHKNFKTVQTAFNGMRSEVQFLRRALGHMYQQQIDQERQSRVTEFHSTLDRMKSPLFGTSSKLTPLQQRNRAKLAQDVDAFAVGRQQQGKPVPPVAKLVDRVSTFSFRNQLAKQQQRTQQQPTNGKPARPRLGTPGRGRSRKDNSRMEDWDGEFEDNPALHNLYKQMAETSGNG